MNKQLTLKTIAAVAAIAAVGLVVVGQSSSARLDPTLRERLIAPSELAAFATVYCPAVVDDANRWAGRYTSTDSLHENGFVAGLSEPLYSPSLHAQGVSAVIQFRSGDGARSEIDREVAAARRAPGRFGRFAVGGVPGAEAFTIDRGGLRERDVAFTAGDEAYLIGVTYRTSSKPISKTQLADAARALYERVQ
jgi:hypothetical protein